MEGQTSTWLLKKNFRETTDGTQLTPTSHG